MRLLKTTLYVFGCLILTMGAASCDDDDPQDGPGSGSTSGHDTPPTQITLPRTTVSQMSHYTVQGEDVLLILNNINAVINNAKVAPSSYSVTLPDGTKVDAKVTGTSDSNDVTMVEFPSSALPKGYSTCSLTMLYTDGANNASNRVEVEVAIISAVPKCGLRWNTVNWGGYTAVYKDDSGNERTATVSDLSVTPRWSAPDLTINLGPTFSLPDRDGARVSFNNKVNIGVGADGAASNFTFTMSNVRWEFDGTIYAGVLSVPFASDEPAKTYPAKLTYDVAGEMDGVMISETQSRTVNLVFKRD